MKSHTSNYTLDQTTNAAEPIMIIYSAVCITASLKQTVNGPAADMNVKFTQLAAVNVFNVDLAHEKAHWGMSCLWQKKDFDSLPYTKPICMLQARSMH